MAALLLGCNAPAPPGSTGGVELSAGPCGRGLAVVHTDYQSTNVSILDTGGEVLSSSFVSSATSAVGLSAPLSGDVVLPTMPNETADLILIDRYPAAVISWLDLATGSFAAQLSVATGFAANPQDYLPVSEDKAYVSRFEPNHDSGREPWDLGSDLLVIDLAGPRISGRIDLAGALPELAAGLYPRPNRMVLAAGQAVVLLAPYSSDFSESGESLLAVVDTASDQVIGATVIPGLHGCAGLARSPAGDRLAVACSGSFGGDTEPALDESGLVVLAVGSGSLPAEVVRFSAAELSGQPLGFTVDFAAEDTVLFTALGSFGGGATGPRPDALLSLELGSGQLDVLLESQSLPFELGEVRCLPACGRCFVADAERSVLHRLSASDGELLPDGQIVADVLIGLPPRVIGRL